MEADFVGEVPDYLKCIVCHLVFKEPVMIIECGHRLCKKCFEDMCNHSNEKNTPLLCPIDRNEVEPDKVVDDKGIRRVVMDLKVKCDQSDHGCNWSGDLAALPQHKEKGCGASFLKKFMNVEDKLSEKDEVIKILQERMSLNDAQVNERFLKNEEEIKSQYDHWKESLERKLCQRDEEVALLRYQVCQLRSESLASPETNVSGINSISPVDTQSPKAKRKGDNSASIDHDERDEELRRVKELLQLKDDKICQLEYQLARVKNDLFKSQEQSKNSNDLQNDLSSSTVDIIDTSSSMCRKLACSGNCKEDAIDKNNCCSSSNNNNRKNNTASFPPKTGDAVDKKQKIDYGGGCSDAIEKNHNRSNNSNNNSNNNSRPSFPPETADVVGKKRKMDSSGSSKDSSECVNCHSVDLLLRHVMNVEEYVPGDRTVFKWRIHDFARRKEKGDEVDSTEFYSSIPGHLCQLFIDWEDDGGIGLFITLCKGVYEEGIRSEFRKTVTFRSIDKYGKTVVETISKDQAVDQFRDKNKPGMNQFKEGFGFPSMFTPAKLERHVIDDTLTIICVIDHK